MSPIDPNKAFRLLLLQVWGGAADAAAGAETGAVARMHSALIAVVAHLLARLGGQALDEAQVCLCAAPLFAWPLTTCLHMRCRLVDMPMCGRLLLQVEIC